MNAVAANYPDASFIEHSLTVILIVFPLIGLPIVVVFQAIFSYQSLLVNFPMQIRWSAHQTGGFLGRK